MLLMSSTLILHMQMPVLLKPEDIALHEHDPSQTVVKL